MTHCFLAVLLGKEIIDESGDPILLRKVCNNSLIQIIDKRLRSIDSLISPVLFIHAYEPQTITIARKLGWKVVIKNKRSIKDVITLFSFLRADYYIFTFTTFPFIDKVVWKSFISKITTEKFDYLYDPNYKGFSPYCVVKRNFVFKALLKKIIQKSEVNFFKCIQSSVPMNKQDVISFQKPLISDCFRSDTVNSQILSYFCGIDTDLKSIINSDVNVLNSLVAKSAQEKLYTAMLRSNIPHKSNIKLSIFEAENNIFNVKSFPHDVAITITDKCNANCIFCNYKYNPNHSKNYFTLSDFKKMTWLRYVSKIGLGGGLGEPLVHPEFVPIFKYLTTNYPHLLTRIITNGILLDKVYEEFVGKLSRIRISLNAATPQMWSKLMRARGFERICDSIRQISKLKQKLNTDKPEIILMMVVSNTNIHETVNFVELANNLGCQSVNYSFFSKSIMSKCDMEIKESMYYYKEKSNLWLEKAEQRAKELNVKIFDKPLPFSYNDYYFQGERVEKPVEKCYCPWHTCYLINSRISPGIPIMEFCCVGVDTKIKYERSNLTEKNFIKLWNHQSLQNIRKTVNTKTKPNICNYCKSVDQEDPFNFNVIM